MKIKILYAEDDEFTRKFEIRRLKECGFNVSSVEDGQEAWDEYQKGRYDLLLLDGDMPKMQGEEVMRLVREAGCKQKSQHKLIVFQKVCKFFLFSSLQIVFQKVCKSFLFSSLQIYSFLIK